jgi:hypothetical protein
MPAVLSRYQTLIAEMRDVLVNNDIPLFTRYMKTKQMMVEAKVGYFLVIGPWLLLVHPENRNKLGVNPHNCHANGKKIHMTGADRALLVQACCVEMPPATSERYSTVIAFNKRLIETSNGFLAPVSETEKYLTLGTSHTGAFCKAAINACKSKYEDLADSNGNLDAQAIKAKNAEFRAMLEEGWSFFVAPYWIDDELPEWAPVAQRALNLHHAVNADANEIESACGLLEVLENETEEAWAAAIESISASEPKCKPYLKSVAAFTKSVGKELVQCIAYVLKSVGATVHLGQDFTEALAGFECPKSLNPYPFMRTAYALAQLTGDKVRDGVGRLLALSDISAMKSQHGILWLPSTEKQLAATWAKTQKYASDGSVSQAAIQCAFARCAIRVVLHHRQKEKWGFDKTVYKTVGEILEKFDEEYLELRQLESGVESKVAQKTAEKDGASTAASSTSRTIVQTTALDIAKSKFGLKIDKYYTNDDDKDGLIWKLKDLNDETATFQQFHLWPLPDGKVAKEVKCEIGFAELKVWKPCKAKVPKATMNLDTFLVEANTNVKIEDLRAEAWVALRSAFDEHDSSEKYLKFSVQPPEVWSTCKWDKGELVLVPMVNSMTALSKLGDKDADDAVTMTVGKSKVVIAKCVQAKTAISKYIAGEVDLEQLEKSKPIVVPYWWVSSSKEAKHANMHVGFVEVSGNIRIPTLVNHKKLEANDKLVVQEFVKPAESKKRRLSVKS